MRVVEDFIKMMEEAHEDAKRDMKCSASLYSSRAAYCDAIIHILSSDEFKALKATIDKQEEKPLDDGWILHTTGEQPVGDDVVVEVKYKDGTICSPDFAEGWVWDLCIMQGDSAIIAYRIISEPEKLEYIVGSKERKEYERAKNNRLTAIMEELALNPKEAAFMDAPTPKQTLLEAMVSKFGQDRLIRGKMSPYAIFQALTEYEENR